MASAGAHRYWSLYIVDGYSSYPEIREVELRAEAGGADLTTPSTPVTAYSTYPHASYSPGNLVDNNTSTDWAPNGATGGRLSFDLSTPQAVAEVAFLSFGGSNGPKTFYVEYSDDGVTFVRATENAVASNAVAWITATVEQAPPGPPDPNTPITQNIYPNGYRGLGGSFSSSAANLVGATQGTASNSSSQAATGSIYTELKLNLSAVPVGAVIQTVTLKIKARASAASTRRLGTAYADPYYATGGGAQAFDFGAPMLTTSDVIYSKQLTWAVMSGQVPEAALRNSEMVFTLDVWGNGSSTTTSTVYVSGYWAEVVYTLPGGGINAIFFGEMF